MRIQKQCACCGKSFIAIKKKQAYCCRKCFKKMYRKKMKEIENNLPEWICQNCGNKIKLSFDPRKDFEMWKELTCKKCGKHAMSDI